MFIRARRADANNTYIIFISKYHIIDMEMCLGGEEAVDPSVRHFFSIGI